MTELNDTDRERWFAACDAVTAAQSAFSEENDRYSTSNGEMPKPLDHAALERLRELATAEDEARRAREQVIQELRTKLGH